MSARQLCAAGALAGYASSSGSLFYLLGDGGTRSGVLFGCNADE